MKKYKFIVEKTGTGYSAFVEDFENYPVSTTGKSTDELKTNMLDALNTWLEFKGKPLASLEQIITKIDLPQFFEYYKEINAKALSKRIGMNETLLSQYVNGKKEPSQKQISRILNGVKELGKELTKIEIV